MKRAILEKNRIEAISDGIYAIAMTLAVLSIDVDAELPTHESLLEALPGMLMQLRHYIVSFITLAAFWIGQHYLMDRIKKTDTALNWIVLIHLLFIAIIPATTGVIGNFDSILAVRIFVINIFLISLTIVIEHTYVRRHEELGTSMELQKHIPFGFLILPGFSVVVFFLAVPLEDWATLFYVLMPVMRKKLT
ncbi:MAG: DUF1211 domain-containing protein [Candidatus Fermentibacteraceae bacterium]|nr:DUF1211 domain-containing protein [Candidatus Fermentibacteraceae bacterium]